VILIENEVYFEYETKNRKKCTFAYKAPEFEILLNVIRRRVTGLIRGLNR
jgi:hypothetical protein